MYRSRAQQTFRMLERRGKEKVGASLLKISRRAREMPTLLVVLFCSRVRVAELPRCELYIDLP